MREYLTRADSLIELEFVTEQKTGIHYHENIELLFVLQGSIALTVEDDEFELNPDDMIVINANRKHGYEGIGDLLIGRFVLSHSKISGLLGSGLVLFWCNSTLDNNKAYDELRLVISKVFNQYLKDEASRGNGKIYLSSLYYQMLYVLTGNFLLTEKDARYEAERGENDDRVQEIFAYIRLNYKNTISLQEIAEQLYLSPTYISKYIKRKCNSSFIELVNSVRLAHAMEDLMYTESSVMKIAMDNGFASVAAYNKAFKDAYASTPSEFRKTMRHKAKSNEELQKMRRKEIAKKVETYLVKNPVLEQDERHTRELNVLADAASNLGIWENNCGRMINAGTALDLTKTAFREQILAAKDRIGIEYVRFWDICNPELFMDIHAPKEHRQFAQLDAVTDFLVKNNMKPYIELGFKPLRLLKTAQDALKEIPREQEFASDEEMRDFYNGMIKHFANRYGHEVVEKWYFEYWEEEGTKFQNLSYQYSLMSDEKHEKYFERFDIIADALRSYLPEVKIGGGGFPLQHYGKAGFAGMLKMWQKHKERPDFITITCYPYKQEKEGNVYYEKRSTDMDFVKNNLKMAKDVIEQISFETADIHVSEYSMTLSNRNIINDNCAKGAFLVKNAISCMGETDMLGHWLFTDTYADFNDSQDLLFGGCGILTKNGIPKPGFYALEFLSRLYKRVVAKDYHYILTANERGSFRMVCHNFKDFSYHYFMTQEDKIKIKDIPLMIDNRECLAINYKIEHVKNGVYVIKQKRINKNSGSIQDEWSQLNMESELTMEELDYLKKINAARLSIREIVVQNNTLEIDVVLEPNEIQQLHIFCK